MGLSLFQERQLGSWEGKGRGKKHCLKLSVRLSGQPQLVSTIVRILGTVPEVSSQKQWVGKQLAHRNCCCLYRICQHMIEERLLNLSGQAALGQRGHRVKKSIGQT